MNAVARGVLIALGVVMLASGDEPKPAPRAWLGVVFTFHQFSPEADPPMWLYVQRVEPNSPALAAGMRVQDAIVAIDGRPLQFKSEKAAIDFFRRIKVGSVIRLSVLRAGKPLTLSVRAAPIPRMYLEQWKKNDEGAERDASRRKQ